MERTFKFCYFFRYLIIMNQVVLIGLISLSCICIFFIYQNIKLKRMYTEEFTRINKNMNDMTRLVSLNTERNNVLNPMGSVPPSTSVPSSESDSKYDKLKTNYEEYVKTNFEPYEFDNVPDEVKEGIESLTGEGYVEEPLYIGEPENVTEELDNENFSSELADESGSIEENQSEEPQIEEEEQTVEVLSGAPLSELRDEESLELEEVDTTQQFEVEVNELIENDNEESLQMEEVNIVNDIVNGITGQPVVVEQTFSVNDNIELEFEETPSVDLENFAKSNTEDLENMTLKELQQLARDNNVKVKGKKNELIDRLKEKLLVN